MYFFNIHEKFTAKQAYIMGNFAEVLVENQSKNVNIISVYNEVKTKSIYNQVARISVNPNTRSTGAAIISINPARHTSKINASGRRGYYRYLLGKIQ